MKCLTINSVFIIQDTHIEGCGIHTTHLLNEYILTSSFSMYMRRIAATYAIPTVTHSNNALNHQVGVCTN